MSKSTVRKRPVYPKWNYTNVWEISGRRSIKREDTIIVAITPRHRVTYECDMIYGSGSGSDHIITWSDFEKMIHSKIKGVFSVDLKNVYIYTDYSEHIKDGLNTKYHIIRTEETICSHITPGLLKALSRINNTDAKGFVEKSQNSQQFKCKPKHTQSRKGEERGYIAWRSRVF